jgi:hypothetical protein
MSAPRATRARTSLAEISIGSKGMVFTFGSLKFHPGRANTAIRASLRTSCGRYHSSSLLY